jgi:hypothetical protein
VEAQAVGARGRALIDAHFTLDRVLDAHLATFSELLGRA